MARVTSQQTRRAILTTDTGWDPNLLPERIALFNENGDIINFGTSSGDGVPPGGVAGQLLTKATENDFETEWADPPEGGGAPAGGLTGQVLVKLSDADYDVAWVNVEAGGLSLLEAWRGEWLDYEEYEASELVRYDGSLYLALRSVYNSEPEPSAPYEPPLPTYYYPAFAQIVSPELEMIEGGPHNFAITADGPDLISTGRSNIGKLFAFRLSEPGTVQIRFQPQDGVSFDTYATLMKYAGDGVARVFLESDDDDAGLRHPNITRSLVAGDYFVYFETYQASGFSYPINSQYTVTLSDGAVLEPYDQGPAWALLARGVPDEVTSEGMRWAGQWVAGAYSENDVVRHNSGLYIAKTVTVGSEEPGVDLVAWELVLEVAP